MRSKCASFVRSAWIVETIGKEKYSSSLGCIRAIAGTVLSATVILSLRPLSIMYLRKLRPKNPIPPRIRMAGFAGVDKLRPSILSGCTVSDEGEAAVAVEVGGGGGAFLVRTCGYE